MSSSLLEGFEKATAFQDASLTSLLAAGFILSTSGSSGKLFGKDLVCKRCLFMTAPVAAAVHRRVENSEATLF